MPTSSRSKVLRKIWLSTTYNLLTFNQSNFLRTSRLASTENHVVSFVRVFYVIYFCPVRSMPISWNLGNKLSSNRVHVVLIWIQLCNSSIHPPLVYMKSVCVHVRISYWVRHVISRVNISHHFLSPGLISALSQMMSHMSSRCWKIRTIGNEP